MTEVVKRQNSKSKKSFNQVKLQIMVLLRLVTAGDLAQLEGKRDRRE